MNSKFLCWFFLIVCLSFISKCWSLEDDYPKEQQDRKARPGQAENVRKPSTTPEPSTSTEEMSSTSKLPRFELRWREAMGWDTESFKRTPGALVRAPIRAFQNGLYYYLKYHGG